MGGSDFSINSGPVEDNVFGNSSKFLPGMIIHSLINCEMKEHSLLIEIKPSSPAKKLHPKLAVKASLKKKAAKMAIRTADAKMNKVHQDDDYIYPALGLYLHTTQTLVFIFA